MKKLGRLLNSMAGMLVKGRYTPVFCKISLEIISLYALLTYDDRSYE